MSTFEQQFGDFTLWQKDFLLRPPIEDEFADDKSALERSRCEIERLLLGLEVEAIKQKLNTLGIEEAASTHTIHKEDGYVTAYLGKTAPLGRTTPEYVRVIVNEITQHSQDERTAELEEYFVDLAEYSLHVYRGPAKGNLTEWTIENGSPPFISNPAGMTTFDAGHGYNPTLPPPISDTTTFEEINLYRQEAVVLVNFLNKLNDVSENIRVPYE